VLVAALQVAPLLLSANLVMGAISIYLIEVHQARMIDIIDTAMHRHR